MTRVRLQFHQYKLAVPVADDVKSSTVQQFVDYVSKYLQNHFNNKAIKIVELQTSDRYALNNNDKVGDVINDNEVLICLDEQLYLEREIKVYCDRKNAWLHVERKKQPKNKKRRGSVDARRQSNAGTETDGSSQQSRPRRASAVSIVDVPETINSGDDSNINVPKWAEVGYNTRNKVYVLLGVGTYTQLYLFSLDDLRANNFQEQRVGIIEDDTGDWYTLAKFEKEDLKKEKESTPTSEDQPEPKPDMDEAVAAIGLHVKAEGDQMANAEQIIIRVTKDGLLTTDMSEVTHLFGTKSGKRPRKKKHSIVDEE